MRFHALVACIALLGPLSCRQVSCSGNLGSNTDFYVEDEGSGDGPEIVKDAAFTHVDHEGSGGHGGHGDRNRPYSANYDIYDPFEDTEDDDNYGDMEDELYKDTWDGKGTEGSGDRGTIIIDDEDGDTIFGGEGPGVTEETIKEIHVDKDLELEATPSTRPPPTLTDNSDMEGTGTFQISSRADDHQVSIFAQPGILAAFIGGAVVGLLCAILLVMFIVYRMRKKDEGSYPLDEPKRMPLTSSYSPNDKEIYA